MKLFIVWSLLLILGANSVYVTLTSRFTVGTLVMWLFIALLLVYAIFHSKIDALTKTGLGFALKTLCITGCFIFAVLFTFVAVSGYANTATGDEKAIIVLGAGLKGENVSGVLARRLDAALNASNKNPNAIIVVAGGQGSDEVITEAQAMQKYLVAKGIPSEKILLEENSTSTEENLAYAKSILVKYDVQNDDPVAISTNAFHCYRSVQYARAAGFTNIRTIPASMDILYVVPSYIREVFALLYFWVFKR